MQSVIEALSCTFGLVSPSRLIADRGSFLESQRPYDFVLNLAAMKHVRSEKDEFSLMRMIKTNVIDTASTLQAARRQRVGKYFAVSTDMLGTYAALVAAGLCEWVERAA